MLSPFPGMDPYLEAYWGDVHHRLCTYACDALQPQVKPALRARIDERVVVEAGEARGRTIVPDVTITEREPWRTSSGGLAVEVAEPFVYLEDEPLTEGFIQIIEPANGGRLVTVIEFLSPSNKLPGNDRDKYLRKRQEYHDAGVNLVEIDLLRRGERIGDARKRTPQAYHTTYQACVRRAYSGQTEVYAVPLRHSLPMISIPLRARDADAHLDLQSLIEKTYLNGSYDDLDYTRPPDPPLDAADAAWAAELLRAAASHA
jgi:hypothetical protein